MPYIKLRYFHIMTQNRLKEAIFKHISSLIPYPPHYVFLRMYFNGWDENILCIYNLITLNPVKTNTKRQYSLRFLYI